VRRGSSLGVVKEVLVGRLGTCLLIGGLVGTSVPARAWSPDVHKVVTKQAIETLPKPLKQFYKDHRLELPSLSEIPLDADTEAPAPAEEGPERRFAADALDVFPFPDLPRTQEELTERFPEKAERVGRLPWLVEACYARLVDAFKARDKAKILAESDLLGGLVADLNNPLALTENFDGQRTGQPGLWVRFTEKLPEVLGKDLDLHPDAAPYLDDPGAYVFSIVRRSYVWVDNLLYFDDLAHRGKSGYSEIYLAAFRGQAKLVLEQLLSAAAEDAGGYWYTAWTAAGRPELP
jgi:hypothetical protein